MNKQTIPIRGMHCRSCEILIEEKLRENPDIKNVHVSYKKKTAEVYSHHPLDMGKIRAMIAEAGYEVGADDEKDWVSKNPEVYKDLAIAGSILFVLYFLAKAFGLDNINFTPSDGGAKSFPVVLLIGITAGFSSCMALIGGLVLGTSARFAEKHPEATPVQKFRPHLFFNLGRILSYFILGGLIGLIGSAFQFSGGVIGSLIIFAGFVMLIVGLQLTELVPHLSGVSFTLPASIGKIFGIKKHHEKEYSHANSMLVGALTFFLPCGFTQAMQIYAMSTGSFLTGGLIMAIFALGTMPGLLGIGGLVSVIKGSFARRFFKGAGLLVLILALFNISNGLNLTGVSAKFSQIGQNNGSPNNSGSKSSGTVPVEDGYQIVKMDQLSSGYSPNRFTIRQNVPVKWIINSKDARSCAASIYSSKIGVKKFLKAGENIVEFTPEDIGRIPFSCSMGMYSGYFEVIKNDDVSANPTAPETANISAVAKAAPDVQILKSTYTAANDLIPNEFAVNAGQPVRFEVDVRDDGEGCMGSITIPDLVDGFEFFEKGKNIAFDFTPKNKGKYYITCAMGAPRGTITVN